MTTSHKKGDRVRFRSVQAPHVEGSTGTIERLYTRGHSPTEYATVRLAPWATVECRADELEPAEDPAPLT